MDVGRCTCVIVKEASPEGLDGGTLYSLYTNVRCLEFELVKHIFIWNNPHFAFCLKNFWVQFESAYKHINFTNVACSIMLL